MPTAGDCFTVQLKRAHFEWGSHRHTDSRGFVYNEGYIQIPAADAYRLDIFNQNHPSGGNAFYDCVSYDGHFRGQLLAQGNQDRHMYAKQFSEYGNLKGIGDWYARVGAREGDYVKVRFDSCTEMTIEHSTTIDGFNI